MCPVLQLQGVCVLGGGGQTLSLKSLSTNCASPLPLQGHEPGGVEEEWVQVFGLHGPVERRLRATLLDFWQQVLNLLDSNQDLTRRKKLIQTDLFGLK